jgi:hypothetical protein
MAMDIVSGEPSLIPLGFHLTDNHSDSSPPSDQESSGSELSDPPDSDLNSDLDMDWDLDSEEDSEEDDESVKPRIQSPDPERIAAEARLRRAREEVEAAELLHTSLGPTASASTGAAVTRRRREGEDEDDKAAVKRRLQSEMAESLRRCNGTTIDLTADDMPVNVKGEMADFTDD